LVNVDVGIGVASGLLGGVLVHEYVQHRVASTLGDRTPKLMGRLSLNPKPHVDPIGTLIAPAIFILSALFSSPITPMFGWGKRHAINASGLKSPKRDAIIIALSGPVTNALLATVAGRLALRLEGSAAQAVFWFGVANMFIAVFEILPLPGRDGARILARFLSPSGASKIDELAQYEIAFLVVFFLIPQLGAIPNGMASAGCESLMGLARCTL